MDTAAEPLKIWTIGHSTRSIDELINLLNAYSITALADVRRFPASRAYPHFNRQPLADALAVVGIAYVGLPELGGRRQPRPDSINTAWRNASFRGYADYMATGEFHAGMERLLAVARVQHTAIMCAEAVWWRCHRSLIADALKAQGMDVIHVIDAAKSEPHPYTSVARIVEGKLTYAPDSGND